MGQKKNVQESKVELDPQTQRLNALRLQLEEKMMPSRLKGAEYVADYISANNRIPGMSDPSMSTLYSGMPGLTDLRFGSPEEAFATSRFAKLSDMTDLQNAYKDQYAKILAPKLEAQLTAAGLGRSGALAEASGNYMTSLAPQIVGESRAAQQNLAQYIDALGTRKLNLSGSLSDPNQIMFTGAPKTTTESYTKGNAFSNYVMPILQTVGRAVAAYYTGGMSEAAASKGDPQGGAFGMNNIGGGAPPPIQGSGIAQPSIMGGSQGPSGWDMMAGYQLPRTGGW